MPELPEVETVVRTLRPHIVGKYIQGVEALYAPALEVYKGLSVENIRALRVQRVERRAKLIILELQEHLETATSFEKAQSAGPDFLLVFHLKMTGRLFVHDAGTSPFKHTRLVFPLSDLVFEKQKNRQEQLFFDDVRKFGYCKFLRPSQLKEWKFWAELGLEPLEADEERLIDRILHKKAKIKSVLLEQKNIVGIGNIYADEALFQAGIRPDSLTQDLSYEQIRTLLRSVQEILQRSIQECGSSIRNYVDANGDAGSFQNNFYVYGRGGKECRICGSPLCTKKVAGRTSVFCPHCQPLISK